MDSFDLDGIRIISSTKTEITEYFRNLLITRSQKLIVTFNLDFYRIASEDNAFYRLCKTADIVIPDGIGIVNLINNRYKVHVNRITGNDVFSLVLNISNQYPLRVALVGSTPEVLSKVKEKLIRDFPKVEIAAAISPPLYFERNEVLNKQIVDELKASKPDVLFVALGCPRQEFWLQQNMKEIGASINVGIGAAFDFYSGVKKRSPAFFQKLSLEWLWRVFQEPVRLSERYLFKDIPFYIKKRFLSKQDNVKR